MSYKEWMEILQPIPSNFNENTFEMFYKYIPTLPEGEFVDFGTGKAKSVIGIALLNPKLSITTFDPGTPYAADYRQEIEQRLKDFHCDTVKFYIGDSRDFPLPSHQLVGLNIDSAHTYELTKEEIDRWAPTVQKDGLIFLDDYLVNHVDVKAAVDELIKPYPMMYEDLNPNGMCCVFRKLV